MAERTAQTHTRKVRARKVAVSKVSNAPRCASCLAMSLPS